LKAGNLGQIFFMKLNIQEILRYFDIKESTDYGDTTAAIAIVGEDLGASLFQHYCENERKSKIRVVDANEEIPTTGRKKGPRLDRWILQRVGDQQILYQAEVKSWCARAIGGSNIPLDISDEELRKLTIRNWIKVLDTLNSGEINGLNKVLIEMKNDNRLKIRGEYKKQPLIIFWDAKSPDKNDFFGRYNIPKRHFDFNYCWVFSCSLYLRHLSRKGKRKLSVEIPNAKRRLEALNRLFCVE
jgi:hypothetical protein